MSISLKPQRTECSQMVVVPNYITWTMEKIKDDKLKKIQTKSVFFRTHDIVCY